MKTMTANSRAERLTRLGILQEPLGYVDGGNVYEYVRCNPVGGVDPMGLSGGRGPATRPTTGPTTQPVTQKIGSVTLTLSPGKDQVPGMEWSEVDLSNPQAGNWDEFGNTHEIPSLTITVEESKAKKKKVCIFTATVSLTQEIQLDLDAIGLKERTNEIWKPEGKKLTKETAYGHEQLHVLAGIKIAMHIAEVLSKELEKQDKKSWDLDQGKVIAAGLEKIYKKNYMALLILNEKHTYPEGPEAHTPYDPLGTMPSHNP